MMVRMVRPKPGERLCDPAAGTFGFMVAANDYLKRQTDDYFDLSDEEQQFQRHEAFPAWSWSRPRIAWPL